MNKRDVVELLKEAGFEKVRETKHEIWKKGHIKIPLSSGRRVNDGLFKAIKLQIRKAMEEVAA